MSTIFAKMNKLNVGTNHAPFYNNIENVTAII